MYKKLRQLEPYRRKDMDRFSTTLWHLKKEMELSHLAQELIALDKKSPEAWCAVGNSYSLQREYESAIKSFQRALHLNPNYAYAHNLAGHEHHSNEAFDKAQAHFRNAIRLDSRIYNSWYAASIVSLLICQVRTWNDPL